MRTRTRMAALALGAGIGLGLGSASTAQDGGLPPGMQALADRIAIEDMVVRYYAHLGKPDDRSAFADYFIEDAVLEVNGAVYEGRAAIGALYESMGEADAEEETNGERGMFHMVLSNPVIEVDGDRATASFIWTGVESPADVTARPVLAEQGREYDRLERVDGRWMFTHRVVIADSAVPEGMLETWERKAGFAWE